MNEDQRLLEPLRSVEPDIRSGVDIKKAIRAGRRTSKIRVIAAVAGVVALIGVAVPALSGTRDLTPARVEFNPLTQAVTVGSAGGFKPVSYETGSAKQVITLSRADGGTGEGTITVFPPGPRPERPIPVTPPDASLSFEWAPGAWAWITLAGPEPDMQVRADRVRQSVVVSADKTPRFPFTLDRSVVLGSLELDSVVTYYDLDPGEPTRVTVHLTGMSITGSQTGYGTGTAETIGEHQATVGDRFVGIADRGSRMKVTAETVPAFMPEAKNVIGGLRFVPDASNPAAWVPALFR